MGSWLVSRAMRRAEKQILINKHCDQFESDLKHGESPDIQPILDSIPEAENHEFRDDLLTELVELRLDYCRDNFDAVAKQLAQQFPAKFDRIRIIAQRRGSEETLADDDTVTIAYPAKSNVMAGQRVGHYQLIREIGKGGMGTVWLAEQKEPVRRHVALKLIRDDIAGKNVINRFEAERQALSLMNHPSIAKVLDAGETETGSPYFVMELIDGLPINEYCDQNKLTIKERLLLLVEACKAVQHAHQKGVIHRDLKPSNILVSETDGKPVAKIIDFGLAKAFERDVRLAKESINTEFGFAVGTLQYMSPDQADLNPLGSDTRTDIYSLGVVLYELLVGSTPVTKAEVESKTKLEILKQICDVQPPRPSVRLKSLAGVDAAKVSESRKTDRKKLEQLLASELDWVAMRALEKDPSRRYDSANEFALDLSRFLNNETVVARPPSGAYQLKKFVSKNKGLVAAVAAMVGILLLGIAGTTYGLLRANRLAVKNEQAFKQANELKEVALAEKFKAEEARKNAEKNLVLVKNGNQLLSSIISGADTHSYETLAEMRSNIAAIAKQQLRNLDKLEIGSPSEVMRIKSDLVNAMINLGNASDAIPIVQDIIAELESDFPGDEFNLIIARGLLGTANLLSGNPEKAISILETINQKKIRKLGIQSKGTLITQDRLAQAYIQTGQLKKAEELLVEVHETSIGFFGELDPLSLTIKNNLANLYDDLQPAKALPLFESAAKGLRETQGPNHRDTLVAQMNAAAIKMELGRLDESEKELAIVIPELTKQLGETHSLVLQGKVNLSNLYSRQGKLKKAVTLSQKIVKISSSKFGPEHSMTLAAKSSLYSHQMTLGQYDLACAGYQELIPQLEKYHGVSDHRTAVGRLNLAINYFQLGEFKLANPMLERSAREISGIFGPQDQRTLAALANLAYSYQNDGRHEQAFATYEKLIPLMKETLGEQDTQVLTAISNLAVAYWSDGQLEKSIPLFNELVQTFERMLGKDHIQTQSTIANLAINYRDNAQFEKAIPLLEEVCNRNKNVPQLSWIGHELKKAYQMAGLEGKIEEFVDQEIAEARKDLKDPVFLASMLAERGDNYLDFDMVEPALACSREAFEIWQQERPDTWEAANVQSLLGEVLLANGDNESAVENLEEAFKKLLSKRQTLPVRLKSAILGDAVDRLIQAATKTGDTERQAKWEKEKAKLQKPKPKPKRKPK